MKLAALPRFGLVGVLQNGLNFCVFALAVETGVRYVTAGVLAALVALLASFGLNRYWTFRARALAGLAGQALRYALVFAACVALGLLLLAVFVEVFGLKPLQGQVAAIVLIAPLSFLLQRVWVFSDTAARRSGSAPRSPRARAP